MKINIKNFGKIKDANIKCSGLTLLTGNNDSGKSTVGKLLFSVIETISIYQDIALKKKNKELNKIIMEFAFSTKIVDFLRNEKKKISGIEEKIYTNDVINIINKFNEKKDSIKTYLNTYTESQKECDKISHYVDEYNKIHDMYKDDVFKFSTVLQDILDSEFKKQFNKENSTIEISNGQMMFSFSFTEHGNLNISNTFDLAYLTSKFYNNVLFIETPWILEHYKLFASSSCRTYLDFLIEEEKIGIKKSDNYDFTSLHTKEMAKNITNCLKKQDVVVSPNENISAILDTIKKTVDGDFIYNSEKESLNFVRDGKNFDISNIASGIKSFGILNTLLKADAIDSRTLLVLDEPEAHLHPIWQVKYAEMIIQLIINGFNIIVASHSEIFIDALRQASLKYELWGTDRVNVYHTFNVDDKNKTVEIKNIKNLDEKENVIYKSFYASCEMIDNM